MATLLHGLLALGAVWFWTLRPPELRPVFQGGDVSLAVTFVAAQGEARGAMSVERGAMVEATADSGSRKPDTTDILTGPETEMIEDSLPAVAPAAQAGRQKADAAPEPPPEQGEDREMLEAESAAPVSAQASADAPAAGSQDARQASKSSDAPSGVLRQGVSGALRMQSEIRPYYPLGARLRGEEGAVTVRVWVNASGRAHRCEVARSSGYPALDQAAEDAARRARYVSTRPGAWRAEAETTLTFRFQLTE